MKKGLFYAALFTALSTYLMLDMADVFIIYRGDDIPPEDQMRVMLRTSYMCLSVSVLFLAFTFTKRTLLELALDKAIPDLPKKEFRKINAFWIISFLLLAAFNYYMIISVSDYKTWAIWKIFGIIGFMLVFITSQLVYASRKIKENSSNKEEVS
ncbi:MAG: septation protein IspZ [Nitrospinae bacterium]|nr:septation protein IspZ [Nitrospinota bacterium]